MASDTPLYGEKLDRAGIALSGPHEEQTEFLQSLVTNDVTKAAPDQLVYTALLTPQGKYLSDFFLYRTAAGDFAIDVSASQVDALLKRLTMYKLRRPISLERIDLTVAAFWGTGPAPDGALADPREPSLGWRIYGDEAIALLRAAEPGDYDLHRLRLAVPESGADLIPNDSYILEAGFERLNGVDFRKGCYVGQEIVARMKHKTELRKGYRLVAVSDSLEPGEVIENPNGKPVGTLYSNREGIGLALLRLDRVNAAENLAVGDVKVNMVLSNDIAKYTI